MYRGILQFFTRICFKKNQGCGKVTRKSSDKTRLAKCVVPAGVEGGYRVHALCYSLYFSIFCLHLKFSLIKSETGEFHDGLGVSTPGVQCRGLGSSPIRELSSCNLAAEPQKNTTPWLRIFVPSGKSKLSSWFSSIFYTRSRNHHSSLNSAFLSKHWSLSTSKVPSFLRLRLNHGIMSSTSRVLPVFLYLEAAFLQEPTQVLPFS